MTRSTPQTGRPVDPPPAGAAVDTAALESRFRSLVTLLYDTSVSLAVLESDVCPFLAPDVAFADPWLRGRGYRQVRRGA